jgi:methyl-accepting chemotaxis protein
MAREVRALLTRARRDVWEQVSHVIHLSEAEVMAAARAVMTVAEETKVQIERSRSVLLGLEDARRGGISDVVREQSLMLREHVADMSARVKTQDEQARDALAQVAAIGGLARQIAKMASEAQLLALNARIESARLAGQSQGFNVVAVEMMRLSNEVAAANQRVAQVAERLSTILPALAHGAGELRGRVDTFAHQAGERLHEMDRKVVELHSEVAEVVRGADAALGAVVRHSQEALSHLQYQDVAAQRLRRVDACLHDLHVGAARALGDDAAEGTIEPPRRVDAPAGEGVRASEPDEHAGRAGEVLLF